jgi:hypothetical protein
MTIPPIDPNAVIVAVSLLSSVATWLYHKVRGDKHESVSDALGSTIEGVVLKVAESDDDIATIRTKLTIAAEQGLSRLGVKHSAATDFIIAQLVERGVTEVRKRVLARKQLESAVADLATKAGSVTTTGPATSTVPVIGAGLPGEVQVTVVQP